ncbi:MAG: hypothetical protein HY736_16695 [Verrucomicrobia bacterium]|nr:hypothetical protein [Verrucomicrobiota bacterium]
MTAIEVLRSTDPHFRPVSLAQGPDAALYIVDRYGGGPGGDTRRVAADVPNRTENAETDVSRRGRIWRVVPDESRANVRRVLKTATVADLVEALGDDNGWRRDTAQRILIEKGDPAATPIVREYAVRGQPPLGRLHALWTLDGLNALDRDTALRVLEDVDARVCSAAIRLSEKFMYPLDDAQMLARLAGLARRPHPAVRLQLALSLGEAARPETDAVIRRLLVSSADQPFLVDAVVSGIGSRETNFVEQLAREASDGNPALARAVAGATQSLLGFSDRHWTTLKPAEHERATPLFTLASDAATPEWVRDGYKPTRESLPVSCSAERFRKAPACQRCGARLTTRPLPEC